MPLVKQLDDPPMPPLIDHIGWRLWQAAQAWKVRFDDAMVAEGYPVFREARSQVLAVLDFSGTPQLALAGRLGMSKQAVNQLIDQLVEDDLVERRAEPSDRRSRIVCYTARGAQLMTDANRVKRRLDRDYRKRLGDKSYVALESALKQLNAAK